MYQVINYFYHWLHHQCVLEKYHVHMCRHTSIIGHTLVGNKIVDHSDVVGASPAGAAPTPSSFST